MPNTIKTFKLSLMVLVAITVSKLSSQLLDTTPEFMLTLLFLTHYIQNNLEGDDNE